MARFHVWKAAPPTKLATGLSYGLAFVSVATALGLSLILVHHGFPRLFGTFSFAAIAITFWYGGTGPGMLTVLLSSLAFSLILFPVAETHGAGWQSFLAIYAMFGALAGWFSASRRRAEHLLSEARDNLEKRVMERTGELARAEHELRRSEDHLRLVIDTVPALIHTGRPDGYLDYFNRRWLDFIGVPLDHLTGWKWTNSFHPDDVNALVEEWRASLVGGEPFIYEARLRRADGEYRWMFLRKVPLRDGGGNVVKWYGTAIDIEDLKQAEDSLRAVIHERARLSAARAEIGMALAGKGSLRETLGECAEVMVQHLDAAFARIWTVSSDGRELELQASAGLYTRLDGRYSRIKVGEIEVGQIAQERKPHLTNDIQNDPLIREQNWAKEEKITSFAGYPLIVEDRIVGVMGMFSQKQLSDSILDTLSILSDGIAQGIERKRAEDALTRQKEVLQKIFDNVPVMIRSMGPDGKTKLVNREWERTMGWTLEEIHGKDLDVFAELYPDPEYRQEVMKIVFRAKPGFADLRTRVRDGRVIDTSWGSVRLCDGTIIGIGRDITDRKQAEEALRKSEERWRSVFENSAIGVALTDLDGRFLATNPVYQKIVGYCEDELRSLSFLEITVDEYREPNRMLVADLLTGKRQQFQMEKQYRRKDGGLIWVRNTVSMVKGTESVPQHIMALSEDITERKRAEDALRRSETYLAAGQRLSHTGSWALNISSGEIFWSEETFRIFGYDPATKVPNIKEMFVPRVHPEDRPEVENSLNAAKTQKTSFSMDYRIVLPDGSIRYIHDVVYPVVAQSGAVVERYGVVMDVTEGKRAEVELQNSRDRLRALAVRLQKVREEERARVSREIHDELGQALTAIKIDLSSLSHEMPAETKDRSESIMKLADETIESVRRISTELRPAVLDTLGPVAAVEWAAEEFEARTRIHCRLDLDFDVAIDPETATALFRIFQETLTNVARHANATEVKVRLSRTEGDLTLEVRDNGKGAQEDQLSAASSLGILGMRERALLLGGELIISSAPGKGTTVTTRIPLPHPSLAEEGK